MILYVVMCVCVGYQKKITQRTRPFFTSAVRSHFIYLNWVRTGTYIAMDGALGDLVLVRKGLKVAAQVSPVLPAPPPCRPPPLWLTMSTG